MPVKSLPRRHTREWYVHAHYVDHKLVGVDLKSLVTGKEVLTDDDLEQKLVDADRAARCVGACDLLNTDDPRREIETLLRDRATLMKILASGQAKPREPQGEVARKIEEFRRLDERTQIGPLDV